jgi:hypothetical protein
MPIFMYCSSNEEKMNEIVAQCNNERINIVGKCICKDIYIIFLKLNDGDINLLTNKKYNTNVENLILQCLPSIYRTQMNFTTNKQNIFLLLKIKSSPFSLKISHSENDKIILTSTSQLPKKLHEIKLKELLNNTELKFNSDDLEVIYYSIGTNKTIIKKNLKRKYKHKNMSNKKIKT